VHESDKGERSFDATWLYKPSDSSCVRWNILSQRALPFRQLFL
jgi:hypothetical protein